MNRKLPRIPKPDGSKYVTGDAQEWTYEYTSEDMDAIKSITDCPTEEIPTMKQIYEFGILHETLSKFESQLGERFTKEVKDQWNSIVDKLNS